MERFTVPSNEMGRSPQNNLKRPAEENSAPTNDKKHQKTSDGAGKQDLTKQMQGLLNKIKTLEASSEKVSKYNERVNEVRKLQKVVHDQSLQLQGLKKSHQQHLQEIQKKQAVIDSLKKEAEKPNVVSNRPTGVLPQPKHSLADLMSEILNLVVVMNEVSEEHARVSIANSRLRAALNHYENKSDGSNVATSHPGDHATDPTMNIAIGRRTKRILAMVSDLQQSKLVISSDETEIDQAKN